MTESTVACMTNSELCGRNGKMNYIWFWNPRMGERKRKGLRCRLIARGARNSALVETEDGELIVCSRNCLRKSA